MKGWCPVHDRVYDAPNGACPECGTTLVSVAGKKKRGGSLVVVAEDAADPAVDPVEVEVGSPPSMNATAETPVQIGVWAIAGAVAIIVIGAFFLGVAISRGSRPSATQAGAPRAREDYEVEVARSGAGVTMRLDHFSQRGRVFTVRVSLPSQPLVNIGDIDKIVAIPLTANGEELAKIPLDARVTTTGFVAEGAIDRADIPITGVEIMNMTLKVNTGADFLVDLTGVWPTSGRPTPTAKPIRNTQASGDGRSFQLRGLVGWPDRLEAGFQVLGGRRDWEYGERFWIVVAQDPPVDGSALQENPNSQTRNIMFSGIRRVGGKARISLNIDHLTIGGHWRWMFT